MGYRPKIFVSSSLPISSTSESNSIVLGRNFLSTSYSLINKTLCSGDGAPYMVLYTSGPIK